LKQNKTVPIEERWKDDCSFVIEPPKNTDQDTIPMNNSDLDIGVGVLVVRDGKILIGLRRTEGTFCGPGGHIEYGETTEEAAIRETKEEFGITPTELIHIGSTSGEVKPYLPSEIYLCTEYDGTPKADGDEMQFARFMEPAQVYALIDAGVAFPPFAESIKLLLRCLTHESTSDRIKVSPSITTDGGPGSGNHGHKGVPGQVGGSAPSGVAGLTKFKRSGAKMSITSDVKVKDQGSTATLKAGTTISKIADFAGGGRGKNLRVAPHLAKQYGGKAGSWTHTRGEATVVCSDGKERTAELHWFESKSVGQVGMKVKRYMEGKNES